MLNIALPAEPRLERRNARDYAKSRTPVLRMSTTTVAGAVVVLLDSIRSDQSMQDL